MSAATLLARWFGGSSRDVQSDGSGLSPVVLASAAEAAGMAGGLAAAPSGAASDGSSDGVATDLAGARRRERLLDGRSIGGGQTVLVEVVAEKVLNGWLQNRHQVLFPLTLNLRTTEPGRAALLTQMMAVAALAGGGPVEEAAGRGRAFLTGVGGAADVLAGFDAALAAPPALSWVVAEVLAAGLAAYGYVVALVVLDAREVLGLRFLEYLESRLALPTAVVRSAVRRYGR